MSHEDWCWLNDSIDVRVPRDEQKSPIELAHVKQSGFLLVCSISHDVEMVRRFFCVLLYFTLFDSLEYAFVLVFKLQFLESGFENVAMIFLNPLFGIS